jgi:hypothetical protein
MNYDRKEIQAITSTASSNISQTKALLIQGIRRILEHKTDDENTFIELDAPVTINQYRQSTEEVVRVYRDGGLMVEQSTQGRMDIEDTIDDLNVSQLFDLLIALDENGTQEEEVA